MNEHHAIGLKKAVAEFKEDPSTLAILLGGSLAHGFATEHSDIDLMLVVSSEHYAKCKEQKKLAFGRSDICEYEGGYVDCKIVDVPFMEMVAHKGSDAARFAFKDAKILFSEIQGLEALIQRIQRFPFEQLESRRKRFATQLLAGRWFFHEGSHKHSEYLIRFGIQKVVFFACRLVLNENQLLFPYHKWMMRVTSEAPRLPADFMPEIQDILSGSSVEVVDKFCAEVLSFCGVDEAELNQSWPHQFLLDSEQNWIEHEAPIEDL